MFLDCKKVEVALARKCLSFTSLRSSISPGVIAKVRKEMSITARSAGKIAVFLGVDVAELIKGGNTCEY